MLMILRHCDNGGIYVEIDDIDDNVVVALSNDGIHAEIGDIERDVSDACK